MSKRCSFAFQKMLPQKNKGAKPLTLKRLTHDALFFNIRQENLFLFQQRHSTKLKRQKNVKIFRKWSSLFFSRTGLICQPDFP